MAVNDSFFPNFINDLCNNRLVSAISALHRHPGDEKIGAVFFDAFCNSSLITITGAAISRPNSHTLIIDPDGLATFEPGSVIPLATLKNNTGFELLPVFTHGKALKRAALPEDLYALAVPSLQLIEMFLATTATVFGLNFGNPESIELPRQTIVSLHSELQRINRLDNSPCVILHQENSSETHDMISCG